MVENYDQMEEKSHYSRSKRSRDLKSKCFTKKMIVIGFEENGTMEFIADAHYMGNELSKQFLDDYEKNKVRLRIESFQRYSPNLIYNVGLKMPFV